MCRFDAFATTHSRCTGQPPGKFPGLHSGFLMQNTPGLISESKLRLGASENFGNVTVFDRICDGLCKNLGRLVIFSTFLVVFPDENACFNLG
jgi:hypothetical protein